MFGNSSYLPPLSHLLEMKPMDFTMTINPQDILLSEAHDLQEEVPIYQEVSQLCCVIKYMHQLNYGSDFIKSCYTMEVAPCVPNQELLTEENHLYNDLYTLTTETIRQADISPSAPPLLRNPPLLSTLDTYPPLICHSDLDLNFVPHGSETGNPCVVNLTREDNLYSNADMSVEEAVVVVQNKKNTPKEQKKPKRTRKNYSADTINILMGWYFDHNGAVPTNSQRKVLAQKTGKSEQQISTWYQNARKRHANKLQQYNALSSEYPGVVRDYRTLKSFLKMKK